MGSQFGIGERLRAERIRRKRSIEDISRETRISPAMLGAIEREDFQSLPALLFTRNFVKQYALALGLDAEPFIAELPRVNAANTALPEPLAGGKSSDVWDPSWNSVVSSMLWLAVAIAAATGAYMHFNRPLQTKASSRISLPAAISGQPGTPSRPISTPPQPAGVSPAGKPAAARSALSADKSAESASAHKVNVSIRAHADSWIQVSADGKTVFTGTLKPNESREISGEEMVKLIAGNAGGITVSLNGRTLDPLGTSGQVKVLRLTEGGPQAVLAAPTPPDDRL